MGKCTKAHDERQNTHYARKQTEEEDPRNHSLHLNQHGTRNLATHTYGMGKHRHAGLRNNTIFHTFRESIGSPSNYLNT